MDLSQKYWFYLIVKLKRPVQFILVLVLLIVGVQGCAEKNTNPEINHISVEKEIKLRGKIKAIALMPTYFEIREKGKDGKLIEVGDKEKERLNLTIRQVLSSKGYVTAEFERIYLTTIRQSKLVDASAGEIKKVMEDFKAICYAIIANEYDEADIEDYPRVRPLSLFPKGNYSLSPRIQKLAKLTGADAVIFTGVWGYIEPKKATVTKTIVNTITAFFGIPFFLPYSNLIQFDVAIIDTESGDVLWFNHGYSGFEPLLEEIPGRPEAKTANEIYY
jgi:hypothetical protein